MRWLSVLGLLLLVVGVAWIWLPLGVLAAGFVLLLVVVAAMSYILSSA